MRFLVLALLLCLFGCAGTSPPRNEYLLRTAVVETNSAVSSQPRVGLGRVGLAPYLSQRGLAIETAANEVRPAQGHVWAEPLDQGLLLFLRAAVSQALGEDVGIARGGVARWEQNVEVHVEQLHGTMSGRALLVASFEIMPGSVSGLANEYRFARSLPLPVAGYAGLVEAQKQLATALAESIAAALIELR